MSAQNHEKVLKAIERVPVPQKQAISSMLIRPIEFPVPYLPNKAQALHFSMYVTMWEVAAHWLIRLEWDSKYKIPFKQPLTRALKEHGLHLREIYRLCERCHSLQSAVIGEQKLPYADASEWLRKVYREILEAGLHEMYSPPFHVKGSFKPQYKTAYLGEMRALRKDIEEYRISVDAKTMPAFRDLMIMACYLALQLDRFQVDFFKPFLRSWSAMHTKIDSPVFKHYWEEDGKLCMRPGKTRAKRVLTK